MDQFIKRLVAVGLHGHFDLDISFSDGVNIVYGINGAGKTTLLHILTNAVNLDLVRFSAIRFQTIQLEITNGSIIKLEGRQKRNIRRHSQVILSIDDEQIETWPPEITHASHEHESTLESSLQAIRSTKGDHDITIDATYFPAFRTMIEAWSSLNLSELARTGIIPRHRLRSLRHRLARSITHSHRIDAEHDAQTDLARQVFGEFVPPINYPSPREIEEELNRIIQRAVNRVASEDRSLLSNAFNRVFEAISQEFGSDSSDSRAPDVIRTSIGEHLEKLQRTQSEYGLPDSDSAFAALRSQISSYEFLGQDQDETATRILRVYEEALIQRDRILTEAFSTVRDYIDAVNDFLDGKQLVTATQEVDATPRLQIRRQDKTLSPLDTLSSGERQIAGLIYSASHIAEGSVILVDEPELSLHIDWQRKVISAMEHQFPSKQLIICTHSPIIGSAYQDCMIELIPTPTTPPRFSNSGYDDEDGIWLDSEELEDIL